MSEDLMASLSAWVESGPTLARLSKEIDLGWYLSKSASRAVASFEIETTAGVTELGEAVDRVSYRGVPLWTLIKDVTAIDVDVALWFGAGTVGQRARFNGEWLSQCGRAFEIWAEVDEDYGADNSTRPSSEDSISIRWASGHERESRVVTEAASDRRQRALEVVLEHAVSERATVVDLDLVAQSGNAGIIVPSPIVAEFQRAGTTLTIVGSRGRGLAVPA